MQTILVQYFEWHFVDVPRAILTGWRNFLVFNFRYFSVPQLLSTLFSYWRRYRTSYGRGFDIKVYFEAFTFNIISRVIGAIMRTVLIVVGLAVEIFIFFAGLIIFVAWFFLPILAVLSVCLGLNLIL